VLHAAASLHCVCSSLTLRLPLSTDRSPVQQSSTMRAADLESALNIETRRRSAAFVRI